MIFYENTKKFKFMLDYLKEIDYELSEKLSSFILDGVGKPEIMLDAAVEISFNRAYSDSAICLLNTYEYYMVENKSDCFPFLLHAVRETIMRNMITVETNSSNKRLYLLKMSNETVKIGIATDVKRRISQIKSASGMDVEKYIYTEVFPDASKKENELHRKYKNNRKNGEYFSVDFCDVEKELTEISQKENIKLYYA